jgi:type IV pilus biogenesis protein CpaD/CtpE
MKTFTFTTLTAAALFLSACADGRHNPDVLDKNFGQTNRAIVNAQIANPQAAQNPAPNSPQIMDGYNGNGIMDGYRQGFQQSGAMSQPIVVNIGGAGGGGSSSGQ